MQKMAPEPPDDVLHFRGKTLTPESPRPLYYPEPSNIPLLSQIDPVYNDTSAHESAPESAEVAPTLAKVGDPAHLMEQYARIYSLLGERNEILASTSAQETATSSVPAVDQAETQETRTETSASAVQDSLSANQLPSTMTATSAQETTTNEFSSTNGTLNHQPPPSDASQIELNPAPSSAEMSGATYAAPSQKENQTVQDHDHTTSHEPDNGINFQTLLDNLSQPVAVPLASNEAAASVSNSAMDSNRQLPNMESSLPSLATLPPRPPHFEQSAMDSSYSHTGDTHSLHSVHAQSPNESTLGSQSNTHAPTVQSMGVPSLPSNQSGGFHSSQASLPNANIDSEQNASKAGQNETLHDAEHISDDGRDDEAPWGPEIQKKYDEFLQDERVYVTEGVWDRFAPGSRLFVGMLCLRRTCARAWRTNKSQAISPARE